MKIVNAIDKNGDIIPIDLDELKNSERLVGAKILKTLFNLNEDTKFSKNVELRVDDNGNLTILKDYNLTKKQWIDFIKFVQTGTVESYIMYYSASNKHEKEKYKNQLIENMENMFKGVCGIFGPIPSYEQYFQSMGQMLIEESKNINTNPMTPEEDNGNLFTWHSYYIAVIPKVENESEDKYQWSVTVAVQNKSENMYWRKRRKI